MSFVGEPCAIDGLNQHVREVHSDIAKADDNEAIPDIEPSVGLRDHIREAPHAIRQHDQGAIIETLEIIRLVCLQRLEPHREYNHDQAHRVQQSHLQPDKTACGKQ